MLQLTPNLRLRSIMENNFDNGKLLAVECYFEFYNKIAMAYITLNKIDNSYASYSLIDTSNDLLDSFSAIIEEESNWKLITDKVRIFVKEWGSNLN